MIEDEKLKLKIAENPKEEMLHNAITSIKKRIMEMEFSIELDKYMLDYLEKKAKC